MVEFDGPDQLWSVGVETYRMGAAFLRRRKLVDRARIVMQQLMETPARRPISASPRTIAWCSSARSRRIRRSAPSSGPAAAARSMRRASARRSLRISAPNELRRSSPGPGWNPSPTRRLPRSRTVGRSRAGSARVAGRSTTRSAIPACAAWRRRFSTNSASRSAASRSRARRCASRRSGWRRSGRRSGKPRPPSPG